jgi:branched-chain amino acid transport system ATP-binding protein
MLRLEGLRKKLGALVVTDDPDLRRQAERIARRHRARKAPARRRLINQISGLVAPDAGSIVFAGRDITTLPMHARAGMGLARTFQVSSILPGFSALENVALAVQARSGSSFRLVGCAATEPALNGPAMAALADVGLGRARAHARRAALAWGKTGARTRHCARDGAETAVAR